MHLTQLRAQLQPPVPALDLHTHPNSGFGSARPASPEEDAGWLCAAADRAGIAQMVLFSLHPTGPQAPNPKQFREANDEARALRDAALPCASDVFSGECSRSSATCQSTRVLRARTAPRLSSSVLQGRTHLHHLLVCEVPGRHLGVRPNVLDLADPGDNRGDQGLAQ